MWCARFTESQLETLKELIRIQGEVGADLEGALEALELARWDDLPEAELPWKLVAEQAELQGISEADVIWDMAGRKKEAAGAADQGAGHASPAKRPANGRAQVDHLSAALSRTRRSRGRTCGPSLPSPTSCLIRPGGRCAGSPVSAWSASPIASATSRPTKSSSSSGPIG